jgi:DNA-binding protein HU-beta
MAVRPMRRIGPDQLNGRDRRHEASLIEQHDVAVADLDGHGYEPHIVSVALIFTRQKGPFSMAMKPSKKSTPKKSQATKKSARRYKATPEGMKDRQHLIDVIQSGTGCTGVAARETMVALLGSIATSLKKNQRVQLAGFGTFTVAKRAARKGRKPIPTTGYLRVFQ